MSPSSPPAGGIPDRTILAGSVLLAAAAAPAVALAGVHALGVFLALPLFVAIAMRPELGAYLYLFATPLIVGIGRGAVMPVVRPNEALLLLVLGGLATRILVLAQRGRPWRPQLDRVDLAIVLLAVSGSILPLLLRFGRGAPIETDDILYALVLWKSYLIFRLFREAVSMPAQVAVCLWLALASSVIVAVIAILQVNDLFGVPALLERYYDQPFGGSSGEVTSRATSTLAFSFGFADLMAMSLAVVVAWLPVRQRGRPLLAAAGAMFLLGSVASGQFSGFIGLGVAVLAAGVITGRLRALLAAVVPTLALAAALFWHVIEQRLEGFAGPSGLPQSWVGRLENLERFVWPELFSSLNWLTGVRPAARVPAPEAWRDWVFIESGYVWLLWSGGVAMLLAFVWFVRVALTDLARIARARDDPIGVAAKGAFAGLVMITTLMLLDPHLTMRGTADFFFPLLGLALVRASTGDPRPATRRAG